MAESVGTPEIFFQNMEKYAEKIISIYTFFVLHVYFLCVQ